MKRYKKLIKDALKVPNQEMSQTKYTLGVTSLNRDKLEFFLGRLKLNIIKDVMMGDNPSRSL